MKSIAITRSEVDAAGFADLAKRKGFNPIPLRTIELVERNDDTATTLLEDMREYGPDHCIFMSSKAVNLLFNSARKSSQIADLRLAIANTIVTAVGPITRDALEREGIRANYMPERRFSSVGVGEVLSRFGSLGDKVLVPRSGASTPFLRDLLLKMGFDVKESYLYDVKAAPSTPAWEEFARALAESEIDGIIFTSASSVRGFFEILTMHHKKENVLEMLQGSCIVSIGPFTADELLEFGVQSITSENHTIRGAFDTISKILSK